MSTPIQIRLYDLFRKELNLADDKAAAFVSAVEEVVEIGIRNDTQGHSTKEDIHLLQGSVKEEIHLLEMKIEQTKSDMFKAMFVTGLVQLIAILGGVLAIVKFIK